MAPAMNEKLELIRNANQALRYSLSEAADCIIAIIDADAWRCYEWANGEVCEFDDFDKFIRHRHGLNTTPETVKSVCHQPVYADKLDRVLQRKPSLHAFDNIQGTEAPTGTSMAAALRRLRKDRPDLHALVLADEMTAHAAMIEAGFRHRTITVRTDDVDAAARTLARHFDCDELIDALTQV